MAAASQLTSGVSLLHNNLASSSSGTMASIHNSLNAGQGKLLLHSLATGQSKDGPEVVQATSIRYLETLHGPVLVVTSTNGTQVYTEDASALIFYLPIADQAGPDTIRYHQAGCFVPSAQHLVIGTSKGTVWPVSAVAAGQYVQLHEAAPASPTAEVSDLCFSPIADAVVTVHNNGDLRLWRVSEDEPYTNSDVVPNLCQAPVRVVSLGAQLAIADGPGTILILDAMSRELKAEVTAHTRWLSAAVSREEIGLLVTIGEDTVLNVWQVEPSEGLVSLHHSAVVTDKLLCGVALHGSGASVVAYDSDQLYHVNF